MTFLGKVMALFPALCVSLIAANLAWLVFSPGWQPLLALPLIVYGFPVLVFRVHEKFFPVREGLSRISDPVYSAWWGAHQIQLLYIAFPSLEALLRLFPGAYSAWLRLWGSRIGRNVYWTPQVQIIDRNLLSVGDSVVFGHVVVCCSHVVKASANRVSLFVRRVQIGNGAFIGAASRLGPGATVADGVRLPVLSDLYVNQKAEATC